MEVRFIIDSDTYLSIPFTTTLAQLTEAEETPIHLVHKNEITYTLCGNYEFGTQILLIDTWCALVDLKKQLELVLAHKLEVPTTWHNLTKITNDYIQTIPVEPDTNFKAHKIHSYIMWRPFNNIVSTITLLLPEDINHFQ